MPTVVDAGRHADQHRNPVRGGRSGDVRAIRWRPRRRDPQLPQRRRHPHHPLARVRPARRADGPAGRTRLARRGGGDAGSPLPAHAGEGAGSSLETAVTLAASISLHLLTADHQMRLTTHTGAVLANGRDIEDDVLAALAVVEPDPTRPAHGRIGRRIWPDHRDPGCPRPAVGPTAGRRPPPRHQRHRAGAEHTGLGPEPVRRGDPRAVDVAAIRGLAGGHHRQWRQPGRRLESGLLGLRRLPALGRPPCRAACRVGGGAMTSSPPTAERRAGPTVIPARAARHPGSTPTGSATPRRPTFDQGQPDQNPPVFVVPTLLGALAVLAATIAIPPMISGGSWFCSTVEVVMVIWLVGVGARLARVPAAAAIAAAGPSVPRSR